MRHTKNAIFRWSRWSRWKT